MRIEARDVRKRFGATAALQGVSFAVEPGARVALIGPNGSGKSTLNRALLGLLRCEGELRVDSRDPARERAHLAREIAYVPQAAPQLAASAGEVVAAVCGVRGIAGSRVDALAQRLGLTLGEIAARPFRGLSGGMKQKLLVALALAASPRLLVLDEPTGSLDAESRARVLEAIAEQPRETTLVLCSHRLEEVRQLASEVLVLEEGRVARRGALSDYLDDTLVSVLDVTLAAPPKGEAELIARGFKPLGEGRYSRLASRREKARVVAELAQLLGAQLGDLEVRDVEHGTAAEPRDA
ncbi:MAG: ABC transporter ATP-binding protein [Deltaproteobacteria bacterium]|nr:ABC transporter ATP-binding protein [Deltaproteobacteria bacterium]